MFNYFISVAIKFFFVLAPFFVLSMFLSMTRGMNKKERRSKAVRITLTVLLACYILYFFGDIIFEVFGITIDSFRVGAGALLFLSAVDLVRKSEKSSVSDLEQSDDFSVVPLSIPITVGPAVIGTLMVMGAESVELSERILGCCGITFAIFCVGLILYSAMFIEKILGEKGIIIMSKLTGLVLSALASQIILEGIRNILFIKK